MNTPHVIIGCSKHQRVQFRARRSKDAAVCTEAGIVANVDDNVAECFKIALSIELFQQSHAVAPEQFCVLRGETAPFCLTLTAM